MTSIGSRLHLARSIQRGATVALGVVALLCAGCSIDVGTDDVDPAAEAEEAIETSLAEQLGLGTLDPDCGEPGEVEVGGDYPCTAATSDGRIVDIVVTRETESRIFVFPTNVLNADEVPALEADAARMLSADLGVDLDPALVDCGPDSIVLDADATYDCEITQPNTGDVYGLTATLTDMVRDDGFQNRSYSISDEPIG